MTTEPSPARLSGNEQIVEHALGEVRTFIDELKNGPRKYKTIASLGGQIAEAYRGRCVLELLQNAHDALPETPGGDPGLITFSLETAPDPVLLIANSGHAFERKDFKGLCQLGQSPKDPNKSVGNKGLGFRSVLEVASGPETWSTATTEVGTAFVFRFDPAIRGEVAAAIAALNDSGLSARSPFDPSLPLVDWTEEQLERYRDRLSGEHVDGPGEARRFLSPYDIPLPIEGPSAAVDDLLGAGHVTVVRLPLDGGRGGSVEEATASVKAQIEGLLDLSMTLFLPRLKALVVDIDGERSVVTRIVDADDTLNGSGRGRRQTVSISRIGPTRDEATIGRFRVAECAAWRDLPAGFERPFGDGAGPVVDAGGNGGYRAWVPGRVIAWLMRATTDERTGFRASRRIAEGVSRERATQEGFDTAAQRDPERDLALQFNRFRNSCGEK